MTTLWSSKADFITKSPYFFIFGKSDVMQWWHGRIWSRETLILVLNNLEYADEYALGFGLCNIIWSLLDNITPGFYLCNASIAKTLNTIFSFTVLSGATWTTLHKVFFPHNVVPKVSRQLWTGFFPVQCCLELLWQQYLGFYLCNVFPRVLKQYWTGIFLVQCCLKSLGQHYKRFFLVQYCPRSIKATLTARKTIFSFSRRPEKMVFPKKLRWDMIFHVLSRKMVFLFPENMILRVGRKMKDDLS